MSRKLVRIVLFAASLAVAWLVSAPAFASGPLCDDRGATRIAPSPTLLLPQQTLEARDADECDGAALDRATYQRDRVPSPQIPQGDPEAVLQVSACIVTAAPVGLLPAPPEAVDVHPGVRSRVERPPRS